MSLPAATRVARLSVGSLLLAQHHTELLINNAVTDHVDQLAGQLARKRQDERERLAVLLSLLLATGRSMLPDVQGAIVQGREGAREAAVKRLTAELRELDVDPDSIRRITTRPLIAAAKNARAHEDELQAQVSAESLVTQWRGIAAAAAVSALRKDKSPVFAVSTSARTMRPRVERTAETETARAYGSEHEHALLDAVRYDGSLAAAIKKANVVREWSALADACVMCWPYNGEQADIGGRFEDGAEPGHMHPRCRCVTILALAKGN